MSKSDQEIRAEILKLRDSIVDNLIMIREGIDQDQRKLMDYFRRFGDFRYRPVTGVKANKELDYGSPTEINIEPMASQMRTTIKSLLDSYNLIKNEILPEDDPEGQSGSKPTQDSSEREKRRLALRESFKRGAKDQDETFEPPEPENEPSPAKETRIEDLPVAKPASPKPWRETTPQAQDVVKTTTNPIPAQSPVTNPIVGSDQSTELKSEPSEKKKDPRQVGLSPELRARLAGIRTKHGLED